MRADFESSPSPLGSQVKQGQDCSIYIRAFLPGARQTFQQTKSQFYTCVLGCHTRQHDMPPSGTLSQLKGGHGRNYP